jgi:dihydroflavonol-4-reductase
VEHLYHCAALVSFDPRDRPAMMSVNAEGTANVVDAALETGVRRMCHVSSTATIGGGMDGSTGDETKPFVQNGSSSAYAISKAKAELEVHRGIAEGLDAVMVNPCVVLGPGIAGRSSMTMVESVRKGSRFFPGGSNAVVDARDVATAMTRLITEGASGERYLLIGEGISYRKLFTLIAQSAGKPAPTMPLPAWALELGWRVEAMRTVFGGRPLITRNTARTASRIRLYDGSKAERLLGMKFRSAEEAVTNVAVFLGRG